MVIGKIFHTDGALSTTDPTYIWRSSDELAMYYYRAGDCIYSRAPRQTGKTSLINRLASELVEDGWKCCRVDMSTLGGNLSQSIWFQRFARHIADACGLAGIDTSDICDQDDLRYFLLKEVNIQDDPSRRLAIFLDEIEGLLKTPFADEFLMTLRDIFQGREQYQGEIYYVLSGFIDPVNLVKNPNISIFGIVKPIRLEDFSRVQSGELVRRLSNPSTVIAPEVEERIYAWVSGHPYLTQRICECLETRRGMGKLSGITPEAVDEVVRNDLLDPRSLDVNLKQVLHTMLGMNSQRDEKIRALLDGSLKSSLSGYYELYLTGAVAEDIDDETGKVKVRNQLYAVALQGLLEHLRENPLGDTDIPENARRQACSEAVRLASRVVLEGSNNTINIYMDGSIDEALRKSVKEEEAASLNHVLEAIRQQRMDTGEMERTLDAIRRALRAMQVLNKSQKTDPDKVLELIDKKVELQQKLEFSIPIIPLFLDYKAELDVGGAVNLDLLGNELQKRWSDLVNKSHKKLRSEN